MTTLERLELAVEDRIEKYIEHLKALEKCRIWERLLLQQMACLCCSDRSKVDFDIKVAGYPLKGGER